MVYGIPNNSAWFEQDCARLHKSNTVLRFLHNVFDESPVEPVSCAISASWPPTSPDLNTCDYFL
jgi:hypothetical protein